MKRIILKGSTDQTLDIYIQDSSSTTGAGKTGLAYNTASLVCYYRRGATGTATALTLATQTVGGAHSDGGFVEIDATNMPGAYRLDLSDAIVATGVPYVTILLKGAANMAPCPIEIQLVDFDPQSATSLGLSNLDAAVTSRLAPTVAGRTLDVSAGGEAGVDWANIGSPTTTIDLSGTTVGVATTVTSPVLITSSFPTNTAFAGFGFVMVDTSDVPATGKTVTATRSIDGGAFAACANAVVEISDGGYKIDLAATDLNGSAILLKFSATDCKTRFIEILTTPTA